MTADKPPTEVWIGRTRGQWPIEAFENQVHAIGWMAGNPSERRLWKAEIVLGAEYELVPPSSPTLRPKVVAQQPQVPS